jgi:hypothetical protein
VFTDAVSWYVSRASVLRTDVSEVHCLYFVALIIEAIRSSETSVTRATQYNLPDDSIVHSHRRENLKSCT